MKLDALPGGNPHRSVRMAVSQRIEGEVLVGGKPTPGNADAHHELPQLVVAALLALGRAVAIVPLVNPVKFEERIALVVERLCGIREVARQMPAQLPALLLDS